MSTDLLKKVFMEALGLDAEADWDELRYRGIEEWDSVTHMHLVGEIEQAFGVMLETQDVLGMSSFSEAKKILARHGAHCE